MEVAILITGARDWTDIEIVKNALLKFKDKKVTLINGGCKGADLIADKIARELNFTVLCLPAEWNKYGRAAGPIRNKEMVKLLTEYKKKGYDTVVLAFHDNLSESKGTKNCVQLAIKAQLDIILYEH